MATLVFYSDFKSEQSEPVDNRLLSLLPASPKIGYIPSDSDYKRRYFNKVTEHYNELGIYDVMYFDLKDEFTPALIPELLSCSAIHLSGGDVYQFLASIRVRQFAPILKKFIAQGRVLIGVSAGAMICAPTIDLCELFDGVKMKPSERKSMGFVDFDFFPHYDQSPATLKRLCDYSLKHRRTVYACDDCEGVIVKDNVIECIGNVLKIENGQARF